jgi:hypothetical protein
MTKAADRVGTSEVIADIVLLITSARGAVDHWPIYLCKQSYHCNVKLIKVVLGL